MERLLRHDHPMHSTKVATCRRLRSMRLPSTFIAPGTPTASSPPAAVVRIVHLTDRRTRRNRPLIVDTRHPRLDRDEARSPGGQPRGRARPARHCLRMNTGDKDRATRRDTFTGGDVARGSSGWDDVTSAAEASVVISAAARAPTKHAADYSRDDIHTITHAHTRTHTLWMLRPLAALSQHVTVLTYLHLLTVRPADVFQ